MNYDLLAWNAWVRNATPDEIAEKLALQQDEIVRLREAVKVLAVYAHRRTVQAQKIDTMPYVKQQVFHGTLGEAKNAVLNNTIAAAAVREAAR